MKGSKMTLKPKFRTRSTSIKRKSTSYLDPVTPGELLLEDFMLPMGISAYRLAKEIKVPAQRIGEILAGRRGISADTDLRLCRFFNLSNGYWLRAQNAHDLEVAERKIAKELKVITPWRTLVKQR